MTTVLIVGNVLDDKEHQPGGFAVDAFGYSRGPCLEAACKDSCKGYVFVPRMGNLCQYCGCFPTKHKKCILPEPAPSKLEDEDGGNYMDTHEFGRPNAEFSESVSNMLKPRNNDISSADQIIDTLLYDNYDNTLLRSEITVEKPAAYGGPMDYTSTFSVCNELTGVQLSPSLKSSECSSRKDEGSGIRPHATSQKTEDSFPVQQTLSTSCSEQHDFLNSLSREQRRMLCLPTVLPDETEQKIALGQPVSVVERQFILRWIVMAMKNFAVTSEHDYVAIATSVLTRHPQLQGASCKGVDGLVKTMKAIKRNHLYYKNRKLKFQNSHSVCSNLENIITKMQKEMNCISPSKIKLQALLTACRQERKRRAPKESCAAHLSAFPALRQDDLLFWEFCKQEDLKESKQDLIMHWMNFLTQMCQYFSRRDSIIPATQTADQATVEILRRMTSSSFFGPKCCSNKRSGQILELFQEKTPLCDTLPDKEDPPRLIGIGDPQKPSFTVSIYMDRQMVFSGPVMDAVVQLVALYWVFQVKPAANVRASIAFLGGFFLKEKARKDYRKYKSVGRAMDALQIFE